MNKFTIFTWLLTFTTIFGTYLNSRQNKYGFIVWGICNCLWLTVDFTRGIYAQAALYVVFICFNIYGWKQWGKKSHKVDLPECNKFYFETRRDLIKFVNLNNIKHYEHRPIGCDLNPSKYHMLIIC